VLALLLAGAMWHAAVGRYQHPVGAGPAGPAVDAAPLQKVWSNQPVVLLGLGDSVTDGYGASPGRSYFDLLARNDDALYPDMAGRDLAHVYPRLETQNRAVSGSVSGEHLLRQLPWVKRYPADTRGIVVITSGGNDLIHDYGRTPPRDGAMYGCTYAQALQWQGAFRLRLKGILAGVATRFPGGCDIFLANVYDPTDGVGDIEHAHLLLPPWPDGLRALDLFNGVIAEVCRSRGDTHLVDMHALFLGHGIHCRDRRNPHYRREDPHYWYYANLEDPNERGYDAIRRAFLLEMAKTLAPVYSPQRTQRSAEDHS